MAAINFDQPSEGIVTSTAPTPALKVTNNGSGGAIEASTGASTASPSAITAQNFGNGVGLTAISNSGHAIYAESRGAAHLGARAGFFAGSVQIEGNIQVTGPLLSPKGDCAEEFDLSSCDTIEPGTVMVFNNSGNIEPSQRAYDKKVAGIVSGAGSYEPAIVLDKKTGNNTENNNRVPIALIGKAYCKVDATPSPIEIGDLLTTSAIEGYAMKVNDPYRAFGAVIGKALGSINEGLGMIPVLVALQ